MSIQITSGYGSKTLFKIFVCAFFSPLALIVIFRKEMLKQTLGHPFCKGLNAVAALHVQAEAAIYVEECGCPYRDEIIYIT
jgi:hypothetical protein